MKSMNFMDLFNTRNNSGFTLIEVLVAMVILSVGLLGTAALITGIIKSNQASNSITTATVLAQDKMEDIKSVSYSMAISEQKAPLSPDSKYAREVTVFDDSPAANMKTVVVTVYWEPNKSVRLQTILTQ